LRYPEISPKSTHALERVRNLYGLCAAIMAAHSGVEYVAILAGECVDVERRSPNR
jgi:hypothetical protein